MPASTAKGFPYPTTTDPFAPASVDFPALAAAIDAKTAREVGSVLSAAPVLDVGVSGQVRAGRAFTLADFTTLLGLSTPVGIFNLSDLTNLGSGGALTNKGAVPFAKGINGTAATAALFAGSTSQALYITDTGAADPFRIKTGSWGCWFRTAKRSSGAQQILMAKDSTTTAARGFLVQISGTSSNAIEAIVSSTGAGAIAVAASGVTDVIDDRWHFVVVTYDGSVVRIYADGALEGSGVPADGPGAMAGSSAPFNIGGRGADAATAAGTPHFGRLDAAFVTPDVLDEDQIRLLMAAKVAHGYAVTPTRAHVVVRRRKRGAPLVVGDFSASPRRLYNFTGGALTDAGLDGAGLTNNGAAAAVVGADGGANGAYIFNGASQYLSASATGVPSGGAARTAGCWFRTRGVSSSLITQNGVDFRYFYLSATGTIGTFDGTAGVESTGVFTDGQWHFAVLVIDNSASDGLKRKIYVDGRLVAADTVTVSTTAPTTLAIGTRIMGGPTEWLPGAIDGVFITDYAMAQDEITSLFAKGSLALGPAPFAREQDALQVVQGVDASNVYVLGDVPRRISGRVNADGTIAEALGGDFRVAKPASGRFTIYFSPGYFSSPPLVTVTAADGSQAIVRVVSATAASAEADLYTSALAAADWPFVFTAEGRGPLPSQHQLDLRVAA